MKTYIILLNNYPDESSFSSPGRYLKQREMKKFGSIFNNQTLPNDTLVKYWEKDGQVSKINMI